MIKTNLCKSGFWQKRDGKYKIISHFEEVYEDYF